MGEVYAVANQKGGVGKTTSVYNLGVALADINQKVLLIDLDPQASLTFYAGFEPDDIEDTIFKCLIRNTAAADTIISNKYGVDLLPANIDLALAEMQLLN